MTVAAIIAAALGGGIVASVLESWFARLRAYETARLLVLADLAAIASLSKALTMPSSYPADVERIVYPTEGWRQNRAYLATRLQSNPGLFGRLSAIFTVIEAGKPYGPLRGPLPDEVGELRRELTRERLGVIGESVVYGPRRALRRYRKLRARRKADAAGRPLAASHEN